MSEIVQSLLPVSPAFVYPCAMMARLIPSAFQYKTFQYGDVLVSRFARDAQMITMTEVVGTDYKVLDSILRPTC